MGRYVAAYNAIDVGDEGDVGVMITLLVMSCDGGNKGDVKIVLFLLLVVVVVMMVKMTLIVVLICYVLLWW